MALSAKLTSLLVLQYATESHAAVAYRSFAMQLRALGMHATAKHLRHESKGERGHAELVASYLEHRGADVTLPATEAAQRVSGPKDAAERVLSLEESVTAKLGAILMAAQSEGDVLTCEFVRPMIAEQIEEEDVARLLLAIVSASDDILSVDQEIAIKFGE